jgi:hypothetical protein
VIYPVIASRPLTATSPRPMSAQQRFALGLAEHRARFPNVPEPIEIYTLQEAAEPVVGRVGGVDLSDQNSPAYQQPGNLGRFAISFASVDRVGASASTSFDIATSGQLSLFVHARLPSHAAIAGATNFAGKRSGGAGYMLGYEEATPAARFIVDDGSVEVIAAVAGDHSEQWRSYLGCIDKDNDLLSLHTELGADIDVDISTVGDLATGGTFSLGLTETPHAGELIGYAAVFDTYLTAAHYAELTKGQI